jgi:sialic acid synthase SpsE
VITQNQIIIRKPWGDLDASLITTIIGKRVIKNVTAGEPVQKNEIEPWQV